MSERFVMEFPSGETLEFSEEETELLLYLSKEDQVTPEEYIRSLITTEYLLIKTMISPDEIVDRIVKKANKP